MFTWLARCYPNLEIKTMTTYKNYKINDSRFTTIDGEIFGISGDKNFIASIYSAISLLESETPANSVTLTDGSIITKG